ncbi:MAG: CO dehydrogenase/acetyl-CoA synthase complex subunit epsilon [Candidatus Thorarchaeota archaeon]|nr:MAG: CO dehydrogenase/acetyl-CoA synthase complex subunit epsilon [Candidatus Thorarchaeota archaeon]
MKKRVRIKSDEATTGLGRFRGLEISIGELVDDDWDEPMGPTPMPGPTTLRSWDHKLLSRYQPSYMPYCQVCCLCTFGKCDLTGNKKGACGINMQAQQSRIVLAAANIGTSAHLAHARHLVDHLIDEYGPRAPLIQGPGTEIHAPITRLITGMRPRTLEDASAVLDYAESQLAHLLSATATGQEGHWMDFESKVFHAGMTDHLALEIGDLAQISTLDFPQADPEAPLVEAGFGNLDPEKATVLCIGHNIVPAAAVTDYITEKKLGNEIEVGGICCTAWDITRRDPNAKVVGPISWQLRFIRSGKADVIIVDEQCVRTNVVEEAQKVKAAVISTSDKAVMGLPDRSDDPVDEIIDDLVSGKIPGVYMSDHKKVGEIAAKVAIALKPKRKKKGILPSKAKIKKMAADCKKCMECVRACPNDQPVQEAVLAAQQGNFAPLEEIYHNCIGCARCESACPNDYLLHSWMVKAAEPSCDKEKFMVRTGRGAIQDTEIRRVGQPIVFGEIPGVIAHVGCANYPGGGEDVHHMMEEFASRRYIIVASGCAAMSAGQVLDEAGKSIYERRDGEFDAGMVVNVGSCVSNSHIAGAAIKIAAIFAKRNLRGNYEEIADYIYNRVGAVGISWGAMSQKAASIAAGFWRLGVPVIVGPHGSKYRRMLMGRADKEKDWLVWDARTGDRVSVAPGPEHLFYAAETVEECNVLTAKLCLRPNDTSKGRSIKLSHYIDVHEKYYGYFPDDVWTYIRRDSDIPITLKDKILGQMKENDWEERRIPDPTLLKRMIMSGGAD